MHANELAILLSKIIKIKPGTVLDRQKALRSAGQLSKGKQGPYAGATMTSSDAINCLLACIIDHGRGTSVAANVRRVRSLPLKDKTQLDADFASQLSFTRTRLLGDALDAAIDDIRSGAYRRFELAGLHPLSLDLTLDSDNFDAGLSLWRKRMIEGAGAWFYRNGPPHSQPTWRHVSVRCEVFLKLAEALGPLQ